MAPQPFFHGRFVASLWVISQKGWKQLSLLSIPMGQVCFGAGYIPAG